MLDAAALRALSVARLEDARVLHGSGRYDGAAYICGYAVELALKARICDTLNVASYPENLPGFKIHNLNTLLLLSGRSALKPSFLAEWSIVEAWNPDERYRRTGLVSGTDTQAFLQAVATLLNHL